MTHIKNKLLLAEDDPDQILMYEVEAKRKGIDFISARSEPEIIEKARKEKPNIILLDLLIGESYGLDILRKLRENPDLKDTKIIVFTNYKKKGLKEECLNAGASDYLIKAEHVPSETVSIVEKYFK